MSYSISSNSFYVDDDTEGDPPAIVTYSTPRLPTGGSGGCTTGVIGGTGITTNSFVSNSLINSLIDRCPLCHASVTDHDMPAHDLWHLEQQRRIELLESLLRDVLVNKIDIDKLLDL